MSRTLRGSLVLVTGGAGFIGSHLVGALADCRVRVLDDLSTGRAANLAACGQVAEIELLQGDVRNSKDVARALEGVRVVFHLACRGVRHSLGHPRENHEVNATGTLVVLEESHRAGVERFVHVSSSEVYGTAQYVPMDEAHPCCPETVYGASKLAGEAYARAFYRTRKFPTVVVRPFNNFGPRSHHEGDSGEVIPRFGMWALNGVAPVIFGDGEQTRDFLYVEDTALWLRRVAESDELVGATLNLGSGMETSIRELARIVYEEAGRADIVPRHLPPRPGDVRRHLAGVKLVEDLLGFRPRTELREGIQKLLDSLRDGSSSLGEELLSMPELNWDSAAGCRVVQAGAEGTAQ
jgi:UDP-glucose 4-epimerase